MSLFNRNSKETDIEQMQNIAILTVIGYITRQRQGISPKDTIDNSGDIDLIDITQGQVINFLFGMKIDVSGAAASDELKQVFIRSVRPHISRIANEAIYQDEDLGRLSLNTLEQKASLLEKSYGSAWNETDEGERIAYVLQKVYGHTYSKSASFTKYKYIVFTAHEKYKKYKSTVEWDIILSIDSYA